MKAFTVFRSPLLAVTLILSFAVTAAQAVTQDDGDDVTGRVYVMTNRPSGNAIIVYNRAEDGSLAKLQEVSTGGLGGDDAVLPPPLPPNPGPDPLQSQDAIVLTPDGRFLLAVNAGSNEISVLRVTRSGLELVSKQSSGGTFPVSVAQHRDIVYVLNEGESPFDVLGKSGSITGFHLGWDGKLSPIPNSTRDLGPDTGASDIIFSGDGDTLVVTEMFTNLLDIFHVSPDGTPGNKASIPTNQPTPFGAAFRGDIMTVTELHVIPVDGRRQGLPNASTISSYRVQGDGSLQTISNSVAINRTGSCWVRFSRDGRFAYTVDTLSGTISTLTVSKQGELTLQGIVSSGGAFSAPIDMDITADGKFLYVVLALGQISHTPPLLPTPDTPARVQGYQIQEDGTLIPIATVGDIANSVQGLVAR